ncbi:MAG: glutamate--tRNA ligase [Patescibacteria group bacterium]|nr:glutamate--tRNA ligase [Patescibacteria group bacterium]
MFFKKKVRVRFAPSPTGLLHIGSLRTALYNWLFARRSGGTFILRIEDTDQTRTVAGGEKNILESLGWADLMPDEGMVLRDGEVDQTGKFGPYRQSERLDLYKRHAQDLIAQGRAYYCFCTEDRLRAMREDQIQKKQPPRYDGLCRDLKAADVDAKLKQNIPHVIRLRVPEQGTTKFNDIIHGDIEFKNSELDDQVLIKSDGFPTYHLANVIDDYLMRITHVIRGDEWMPSTPKHILLYKAFGWKPPQFAHLPLLLNPDRSKLSKRQGDVAVSDYAKNGYLPEAIINFVALLGWNPSSEREIYPRIELMKRFDLRNINKSGAVFNVEKLNWLNNHYIRGKDPMELTRLCVPYFIANQLIDAPEAEEKLDWLAKIVMLMRERANTLKDIADDSGLFFKKSLHYDKELLVWKKMTPLEAAENLRGLLALMEPIPEDEFIAENLEQTIKDWIMQNNLQNGPVLWPMRVALSGLEKSPPPFNIAEILGKKISLQRIQEAISKLES